MAVDLHYFVNVLMAKSGNGLPAYRRIAYYKDLYMTIISEDNVAPRDIPCPECGATVFVLTIDRHDNKPAQQFHACSSMGCDYSEIIREES